MNPLKNPEAEACAKAISEVITDNIRRQQIFQTFLDAHPGLKNWQGQAIGQRAVWLSRKSAEQKDSTHAL